MGKKTETPPAPLPEELAKEIDAVRAAALAELTAAGDEKALEQVRVAQLGMKGSVTRLFERIPKIAPEMRRAFGQKANALKGELEQAVTDRSRALQEKALQKDLTGERVDVTLPGRRPHLGRRHPVSRSLEDICAIFARVATEALAICGTIRQFGSLSSGLSSGIGSGSVTSSAAPAILPTLSAS